jgi:hypothetical protein
MLAIAELVAGPTLEGGYARSGLGRVAHTLLRRVSGGLCSFLDSDDPFLAKYDRYVQPIHYPAQ